MKALLNFDKASITTFKDGDVFSWSYNDETLKAKNDGNNGGTTYWCCSMIAIFYDRYYLDERKGYLEDTYWSTSSNNRRFFMDDINDKLKLRYMGNLNDYERADEYDQMYYADKDCLNLNHPNSTRGNFYIRKGAVKDVDKMKRILKRNAYTLARKIENDLRDIERYQRMLVDPDLADMYINIVDGVGMSDDSYIDEYLED